MFLNVFKKIKKEHVKKHHLPASAVARQRVVAAVVCIVAALFIYVLFIAASLG
jgi:hypothetical protein